MLAWVQPKKMNMNNLFIFTYDKFKWQKVILNRGDFEDEFDPMFTCRAV